MASEKFLAVIGVGEEETARIRLMLRIAVTRLDQQWTWAGEDNADLVVVDPDNLQGQIARNRAYSSGRHCAVLSADEPLREGEVRLRSPISVDALADVLAGAAASSVDIVPQLSQYKADFYDPGAFEPDFEIEADEQTDGRIRKQNAMRVDGLEALLESVDDKRQSTFRPPAEIGAETRVEAVTNHSARSEQHAAERIFAHRDPAAQSEGINLRRRGETQEVTSCSLREILSGEVLGGPATASLPDAPALTLDPKAKGFYSDATLSALVPYCRQSLLPSSWRRVTTAELTRLRSGCAMRPYDCLMWLDVLVHSEGRLARHLDPGGRYVLLRSPGFESDFPHHDAIVQALAEPRRLDEISAEGHASMGEVFNLVNALDAIGLIQVIPRLPRHEASTSRSPLAWFRERLRKR